MGDALREQEGGVHVIVDVQSQSVLVMERMQGIVFEQRG